MLDRWLPLSPVRPTPVEPLDRLGAALGLADGALWVKRDDLTGLAGGGNKVRKLEYLCADAVASGCDVLVTGGGRQSNHVRATAGAANRLGLGCRVVLGGDRPTVPSGNVLLDELLGADVVWGGDLHYYAMEAAIEEACAALSAEGRQPYRVPVGGASTIGELGYVAAARELLEQVPDLALVVTADGSGGTHAGLVGGLGDHARVLGVDAGTRPDLLDRVPEQAAVAAAAAGLPEPVGTVQLDGDRIGPGYGAPTPACREALHLAATLEGLLLDPVYTGKAMAGLVAAAREGRVPAGGRTVFLHTGGLPALFARTYADWVRAGPPPG
ncbi:MAG TPA: D-cysteine desulfhydrase family protein [Acidimicrobiales bacterium]|nr:D-cysteine desulfhydrase family protein [Acidimicrobiales bacterium]